MQIKLSPYILKYRWYFFRQCTNKYFLFFSCRNFSTCARTGCGAWGRRAPTSSCRSAASAPPLFVRLSCRPYSSTYLQTRWLLEKWPIVRTLNFYQQSCYLNPSSLEVNNKKIHCKNLSSWDSGYHLKKYFYPIVTAGLTVKGITVQAKQQSIHSIWSYKKWSYKNHQWDFRLF